MEYNNNACMSALFHTGALTGLYSPIVYKCGVWVWPLHRPGTCSIPQGNIMIIYYCPSHRAISSICALVGALIYAIGGMGYNTFIQYCMAVSWLWCLLNLPPLFLWYMYKIKDGMLSCSESKCLCSPCCVMVNIALKVSTVIYHQDQSMQ